ncbi:MAG: PhzF family phenazine biosynthesis protein [Armatimonadetes bacterium]|nr:PhzF family phenazine biosynthesis protein [Armatimonadota bacterium]
MRTYRFFHVDVFTDRPLTGNPLCVFPEAEGLTDAEMQAIARETNLSETTFVLPPFAPEATYRMRIFTPSRELPFAGHPSLGTAWVLATLARFPLREPVTTVRQEVGIGVLPLELEVRRDVGERGGTSHPGTGWHEPGGRIGRVVMVQGRPAVGVTVDRARVARALNLDPSALHPALPAQAASTGLWQVMVPLASPASLASLRPDLAALAALEERHGVTGFSVFALTPAEPAQIRVRFFAPHAGVAEDPATGSAAGALGAYLAHHRALPADEAFLISQGVEMHRPSLLWVDVNENPGGGPATVRVGGQVVPVMEGMLRLQDA